MQPLIHTIQIGNVKLDNNLALAPMAGTTESSFRSLCRRQGAGLVVTELVSARGICYDEDLRRSWRYLTFTEQEKPVAVQLFGSDPDDFTRAVQIIGEHPLLGRCDIIDLNMGCPVAKVVRQNEGCALMKSPDLAVRIIEACVLAAARPVTVKFRKGWDENNVNAVEFARQCQKAGASALTIHGRTRAQMYGGKADWGIIKKVKQAVKIPVFGNGDIVSVQAARKMLLETGVDGLMIGRAARGHPWIFRQITTGLTGNGDETYLPSISEKTDLVKEHMAGLISRLGEFTAVREMRHHLIQYIKGTPNCSELKRQAAQVNNLTDILSVLEDWRILSGKTCENS